MSIRARLLLPLIALPLLLPSAGFAATSSDPWGIATIEVTAGHRDFSESHRERTVKQRKAKVRMGITQEMGNLPMFNTVAADSKADEVCVYQHYGYKSFEEGFKWSAKKIAHELKQVTINKQKPSPNNPPPPPDLGPMVFNDHSESAVSIGAYKGYELVYEHAHSTARKRTGNYWVHYILLLEVPKSQRPSYDGRDMLTQECVGYGDKARNEDFLKRIRQANRKVKLHKVVLKHRQAIRKADAGNSSLVKQVYGEWALRCKNKQCLLHRMHTVKSSLSVTPIAQLDLTIQKRRDKRSGQVRPALLVGTFFKVDRSRKMEIHINGKFAWAMGWLNCKDKGCLGGTFLPKAQLDQLSKARSFEIRMMSARGKVRSFKMDNSGLAEGLRQI